MILPLVILLIIATASTFLLYTKSSNDVGIYLFASASSSIFASLVPLDLVLGLYIRDGGYMDHLTLSKSTIDVAYMFALQSLVFFLISLYLLVGGRRDTNINRQGRISRKQISYILPKSKLIIRDKKIQFYMGLFLLGITLILLGLDFYAMSGTADYASGQGYKHLRIEARSSSIIMLFLSYCYNVISTIGIVYVIISPQKFSSTSIASFLSTIIISLYFSQISNLILWLFVYIFYFWKDIIPTFKSLIKKLFVALPLIMIAPLIKVVANLLWLGTDRIIENKAFIDGGIFGYLFRFGLSFSKIEGLSAFEVVHHISNHESLLLRINEITYLDVFKSFIPFIGHEPISSRFEELVRPDYLGGFSFSSLAEALYMVPNFMLAPVIAATVMFLFIAIPRTVTSSPWVNIILVQAVLRYPRLDLYSVTRRYFLIELISIIIAVNTVIFVSRLIPHRKRTNKRYNLANDI